jgi:hypothetical protein
MSKLFFRTEFDYNRNNIDFSLVAAQEQDVRADAQIIKGLGSCLPLQVSTIMAANGMGDKIGDQRWFAELDDRTSAECADIRKWTEDTADKESAVSIYDKAVNTKIWWKNNFCCRKSSCGITWLTQTSNT